MMRFFSFYQYLVPTLLFPLSYWLWLSRYNGDHWMVVLVLSVPICVAYVVPSIGASWLGLWEINTRWKLGRIRFQHGFLLGTASSLLALLSLSYPPAEYEALEVLRAGFVLGCVLGFWNWFYDVFAIRAGILLVYNRSYFERRGAEAISMQYAPAFFGTFGFCYGSSLRIWEYWLVVEGRSDLYWPLLVGSTLLTATSPVVVSALYSLATTGESGFRSYKGFAVGSRQGSAAFAEPDAGLDPALHHAGSEDAAP
jgi:hypothetical protein